MASIAKIIILDLEMIAEGNNDGDGKGIGLDGRWTTTITIIVVCVVDKKGDGEEAIINV
jgi:hypothetical protein